MLFAVRQWRKDLAVIAADQDFTAAVLDSTAADLRSMAVADLDSMAAALRFTAAVRVSTADLDSTEADLLCLLPVRDSIIVP